LSINTEEMRHLFVLHLDNLEREVDLLQTSFGSASASPRIVLDGFHQPDAARKAMDDSTASQAADWHSYVHMNEAKSSHTDPAASWSDRSVRRPSSLGEFSEKANKARRVQSLKVRPEIASPEEGGGTASLYEGGYLSGQNEFRDISTMTPCWLGVPCLRRRWRVRFSAC
jgi:hypothetical protein